MSNDKCITYKQDGDEWKRTTFEELEVGDTIKIYNNENDFSQGKVRGDKYWKVTNEPYLYEEDNMGVICDPVEIPEQTDHDHGEQ